MRVAVYPDGAVRVTVPRVFSARTLEKFLAKYASWIEKAVARTDGRTVLYGKKALVRAYKEHAEKLAQARCAHFAALYGVSYKKISIRAQKARWGSCSRAGNLSFNYKIALLPPDMADYVIVHEVCHLLAFDHSPRFWGFVARTVPEHKRLRAVLRRTVIRFE